MIKRGVIILTLMIALVIDQLPWPTLVSPYRPALVLLVLLYWQFRLPRVVSSGTIFSMGLMTDLLTHAWLGQHALAWLMSCRLIQLGYRYCAASSWLAQGGLTFFALGLNVSILYLIQRFTLSHPVYSHFFYELLLSLLCWPWVWVMLGGIERRYAQHNRVFG